MLAVPIIAQVPAVVASLSSIKLTSFLSISLDLYFAQNRLQSVHAPNLSPLCRPVIIGPETNKHEGMFAEKAPIIKAGTVLSQPPIKITESIG